MVALNYAKCYAAVQWYFNIIYFMMLIRGFGFLRRYLTKDAHTQLSSVLVDSRYFYPHFIAL